MPPQAPDLAAAAQRLVTEARARLAVGRAALFLRRPDSTLVCVATAGQGDETAWVGQALRAGVGVAGRTVAEGRPVWSPDLLADPRIPVSPWLRERLLAEGLRSVLAAPLNTDAAATDALLLKTLSFYAGLGRTSAAITSTNASPIPAYIAQRSPVPSGTVHSHGPACLCAK